jgi:hypothetical protein
MTTAKAPSDAFRKFYRQILSKLDVALETQSPQERLSGYVTLPFDRASLQKAEKLMDRFMADLIELSKESRPKTDVYHLAMHLFNLTPKFDPQSPTRTNERKLPS